MRSALPLLLVPAFLVWHPLGAAERVLNTIAIVVNDGYLTLYDVKKEIAPKAPDAVTDGQIAERKKEITDKLVGDLLVKQEIKKRNITVSDAELDLAIENVAERNRITVDKLKEEIAGQGISWDTYRNEVLRRQLEILSLKRDIAMATLDVDETTLRDLYRRHFTGGVIYSASHIVLQVVQGASDADIYDRIVDIHRAVQGGKLTFEEAAQRYSEDAAARNGGKLPSFRFNEMDPKFSEEVAKLDPGEMSRPFRSRFGWHIVRLDDVEKSDPPPYEQVRDKVRYLFYQMNQEKAFESWIKAKRQSSAVKVLF
ncbi:MAG TPA: peptidylprolyl isomerase [bacterium]|nr:peptidylprolyl isomerase [bacterium]